MLKHLSALAWVSMIAWASGASAQTQVNVDLTPEEQSYNGRTDARIRTWIHEDNREATDEERTFITDHWKRSARLWRIRKLAREANDTATVARVDALLLRADGILEAHLARLRAGAPVMHVMPASVEVQQQPPPPQQENEGVAPSPNHRWTPGYWQWNGGRYNWAPGRWVEPPQQGMVYQAPRWESRNGRWGFVDGRWNAPPAAPNVVFEPPPPPPTTVEVETAPPPPLVEVRPQPPRDGVWIPGYWQWSGQRHVWIGGRWSAPRVGYHWVPDHWVRGGRGWRRETGRWER